MENNDYWEHWSKGCYVCLFCESIKYREDNLTSHEVDCKFSGMYDARRKKHREEEEQDEDFFGVTD